MYKNTKNLMTIPHLLKQLETSALVNQFSIVTSYLTSNQSDWKLYIRFQHDNSNQPRDVELWRSHHSSLILKGWNKDNYENMYSYGMIHTFVLDGCLTIQNRNNKRHSILLLPLSHHNGSYHQMFHYSTFRQTSTLQLIQTCFNK